MKIKFFILLIFFIFSANAAALEVSCSSYYLKKSNTLNSVSLFYATSIGEKFIEELMPDDEKQDGDITTQFWHLTSSRKAKLFVACGYIDGSQVAKEIPTDLNNCKFTYNHKTNADSTFACRKGTDS